MGSDRSSRDLSLCAFVITVINRTMGPESEQRRREHTRYLAQIIVVLVFTAWFCCATVPDLGAELLSRFAFDCKNAVVKF